MKKEETTKPTPKLSGEIQAMAEIEAALTSHGLAYDARQRVIAWVVAKYGVRS